MASGFSFSGTPGSSSGTSGSQPTGAGFTFGQSSGGSGNSGAASANASGGGFSFGSSSASTEPAKAAASGQLSLFGSAASGSGLSSNNSTGMATAEAGGDKGSLVSSGFSFGSSSSANSAQPSSNPFGAASSGAPAAKPFSFGAADPKPEPTASLKSEALVPSAAFSFSSSQPASTSTAGKQEGSLFGSAKPQPSTDLASPSGAKTEQNKSDSSQGGLFGAKTPATQGQSGSSSFTFGAASSKPDSATTGGFSFGGAKEAGAETKCSENGASAGAGAIGGFSFGTSAGSSAEQSAPAAGSLFGNAPGGVEKSTSSGSNATGSSTGFSFGQSAANSAATSSSLSPAGFGGPTVESSTSKEQSAGPEPFSTPKKVNRSADPEETALTAVANQGPSTSAPPFGGNDKDASATLAVASSNPALAVAPTEEPPASCFDENDFGHDWLAAEAVALSRCGKAVGGFYSSKSEQGGLVPVDLFPPTLASLLDVFDTIPASTTPKVEADKLGAASKATRDQFIFAASDRLGLESKDCNSLFNRFLACQLAAQESKRAAEARKREILKRVAGDTKKETTVKEAFESVRSFVELDAVDSVAGLARLSDERFRAILSADLALAREHCQEIVFGVHATEELHSQVKSRYFEEQSAVLRTVLLLVRTASDSSNEAQSEPNWHKFAQSFVYRHASEIEEKTVKLLGQQRIHPRMQQFLLRILFHLPVGDEEGLLIRMLEQGHSFLHRVPWLARILQLLSNLRDTMAADVSRAVETVDHSAVTLAWSIFSHDISAFERSYSDGFDRLAAIQSNDTYCFVLEPLMTEAIARFELHLFLSTESHFEFFAGLCGAGFRGREAACDEFWRNPEHPLRALLDSLSVCPRAQLELCGALVAGVPSANYALAYIGKGFSLDSLALFNSLVRHLDRRTLLEKFNMMTVIRKVARSHRHDPSYTGTVLALAQKFPQQMLTVLANEPEKGSFAVLEVLKATLEGEIAKGEYSKGLLPGLELVVALLSHVERENASNELRIAFAHTGRKALDQQGLSNALQALGYTAGVDDSSFAKISSNGFVDFDAFDSFVESERTSFARVLRLSLQSRQTQIRDFVFQAVKLVQEVFRSHGRWKYNKPEQRFLVGLHSTRILQACVTFLTEQHAIRSKVADDFMNDTSTQEALISNVLGSSERSPAGQQLVFVSLELLVEILRLPGFHQQKMSLFCRRNLVAGIASLIGFPKFQPRLPCIFPIPRRAVTVLEDFVVAMGLARYSHGAESVPSIVAMLSKAPFLHHDVANMLQREEIAMISLLTTALELEPGLAAILLQEEPIVKSIMAILDDHDNFRLRPKVYCAALEFVGMLWYKGYSATIMRLKEMFPGFWDTVSYSLFQDDDDGDDDEDTSDVDQDLAALTASCYQACIRTWALEIMTIELDLYGETAPRFRELLAKIKQEQRDRSWLDSYAKVLFTPRMNEELEEVASRARVKLDKFITLLPDLSGILPADRARTEPDVARPAKAGRRNGTADTGVGLARSLAERRLRRFGPSYVHDSGLIARMLGDYPDLVSQVRLHNCKCSLADAQLGLLRSWRAYVETRCLMSRDLAASSAELSAPVTPTRRGRGATQPQSTSASVAQSWDTSSFTLVTELGAQLRDIDEEKLKDMHQQWYLLEVAEMFANTLHFKVFANDSADPSLASDEVSDSFFGLQSRLPFRRRSRAAHIDGLPLSTSRDDQPGVVELIEWVSSCLAKLLALNIDQMSTAEGDDDDDDEGPSFAYGVLTSLLTSLLILFEVGGDEESLGTNQPAAERLDAERHSVLDLTAEVLDKHGENCGIYDLCVPLLNVLFVQMKRKSRSSNDMPHIAESTLLMLLRKFGQNSSMASRAYMDQQSLCNWLEQNGLSDLRVKVLSSKAPSTAPQSGSAAPGPRTERSNSGSISSTPPGSSSATSNDTVRDSEAENARLREIARRLGYKGLGLGVKSRSSRNYREFVSKGAYGAGGENGLTEISIIHLLLDHGVTSVSALLSLDQRAMQEMGIYKQSDRRRLLDIVDQQRLANVPEDQPFRDRQLTSNKRAPGMLPGGAAGDSNPLRGMEERGHGSREHLSGNKKQRLYFSRKLGFEQQHDLRRQLARAHNSLRVLSAAMRLGNATVGAALVRLRAIDIVAGDALLRAVAGDKAISSSMDSRDNEASITFRGYTVQGSRDPAHLAWCEALELTSLILASARESNESRAVDQALELVSSHRGALLSVLESFQQVDTVLTLAGLDEARHIANLLGELGRHTQRWRLRANLYGPLLTQAWSMLNSLVMGTDPSRRSSFLEEFVRSIYSGSKNAIPKLCIAARPVTPLELRLDREPADEALCNRYSSAAVTPRASMVRTASLMQDIQEAAAPVSSGGKARSSSTGSVISVTSSPALVVSQLADGDLSVLHVTIEYRICQIVQELLALLRSPQVVKPPRRLQIDEHTGQELPKRYWVKAVVPFPLVPQAAGQPSVTTLLALIGYIKYRMALSSAGDGLDTLSRRESGLPHPRKWQSTLHYLLDNGMYALMLSLELEKHEVERMAAQSRGAPLPLPLGHARAEALAEISKKLKPALSKFRSLAHGLGIRQESLEFVDLVNARIERSVVHLNGELPDAGTPTPAIEDDKQVPDGAGGLVVARTLAHQPAVAVHHDLVAGGPRIIENTQSPVSGVVVWLHGDDARDHLDWEAVFHNFDRPSVRFVLPHVVEASRAHFEQDAEQGVLCWYRNGRPMPPSEASGTTAAHFESYLDAVLHQPSASENLQSLLLAAKKAVSEARSKSAPKPAAPQQSEAQRARELARFTPLAELFALISARGEDRQSIVEAASHIRQVVHEQIALMKGDSSRVILGGFQRGGSLAMLVTLMLALDEQRPVQLGGTVCINSYLPLANECAPNLINALQEGEGVRTGPMILRNGAQDAVVNSNWAELTARTLHAAGLNVEFDLEPALGHSQWHLNQVRPLWDLVNNKLKPLGATEAIDNTGKGDRPVGPAGSQRAGSGMMVVASAK